MKSNIPDRERESSAAALSLPPHHGDISLETPDGKAERLPFTVEYFAPDPDLAHFVSTFYIAHINADLFDEYERADRPQFRFMTAPNGEYIFGNGICQPALRANIIGPTSGKVRAVQHGPTDIFGFGLLPAGWAALVGHDSDKLTDHSIDAADMFGPWIIEVAATLQHAASDADRLRIGNNLVRELLAPAERAPMWFINIVDNWLTASPSPKVSDLVETVKMSLRSIERMTKIYYGLSPRMLARKYRAVRTASLLARGVSLESTDLADAFYDQSHLIREIKHFAGATPRQLQSPTAYTLATALGRKSMDEKVSPMVSDT